MGKRDFQVIFLTRVTWMQTVVLQLHTAIVQTTCVTAIAVTKETAPQMKRAHFVSVLKIQYKNLGFIF